MGDSAGSWSGSAVSQRSLERGREWDRVGHAGWIPGEAAGAEELEGVVAEGMQGPFAFGSGETAEEDSPGSLSAAHLPEDGFGSARLSSEK